MVMQLFGVFSSTPSNPGKLFIEKRPNFITDKEKENA